MNAEQLIERVASIYERTLGEDRDAMAFLREQGLGDTNLHERHRIGYSNGSLGKLLPNAGRIPASLRKLGILLDTPSTNSGQAEFFLNCLVFPIADIEGRIVNLVGYAIKTGDYRHLPDRPLTAWNIGIIKTFQEVSLEQDIVRALKAEAAGKENVICAVSGELDEMDRRSIEERGVKLLETPRDPAKLPETVADRTDGQGTESTPAPEPEEQQSDPPQQARTTPEQSAAIPEKKGNRVVSVKTHAWGFVVSFGRRVYEVRGLERRGKTLRLTIRVENEGRLFIDTTDLYSSKCRKNVTVELGRFFEETPETIEADIASLIRQCEQFDPSKAQDETTPMPEAEREEAESFGRAPDLIERIKADFDTCGLIGEAANKLMCYVAMTSRKMDDPLCILILSSSGAGKTVLQDMALSFCPPEELVKLTSLSGKALFYRDPSSLKHKALAIEEDAGAEAADYALRSLITSKQLSIEAVVKDLATGRLVTMRNVVHGRTSVFLTTTNPYVNPETRSRFIVLSVDESREQTRAILEHQRKSQTAEGVARESRMEETLRRHRNFQRLLKPLKVVNPYAERLGYGDDRLQGRRDQPKYLNMIKALAFLRQMGKPVNRQKAKGGQDGEYIEVDLEDIRVANGLANEILGHSIEELSQPALNLLLSLEEMVKAATSDERDGSRDKTETAFSRRQIREFSGWSNVRVHRYLKELLDFEYVLQESGRNGVISKYRLAWEGQGRDGGKFLLGLTNLDDLVGGREKERK